ncbi:MAG: flippase-like domain-containing protein [Planctomycetales bacterium]|nr:flippase-like domain-containing protein [Planctomycetales bacterium]MBN8628596.1 flippase-like domain-containing protein [Planctomycetota bacterium]
MKKLLGNKFFTGFVKFGLAAALITWLLYDASRKPEFGRILREPKDFRFIALAFGLLLTGVLATFIRWQLLVRALGFPFSTRDALRLGFLGYLFNFVAPGGVGGDIFKAVAVARQFHGRRAQAVATVFIDRIVGLYAILLVASTAVLWEGLVYAENAQVRRIAIGTLVCTVVGACAIVMMLFPGFTSGRVSRFLSNLPRTGRIFQQLIDAVRMYRERLPVIFWSLLISVGVHVCAVGCYYALGASFPGDSPTIGEHFVIVPLALVVGALPITPNGLGTFELAVEKLFPIVSSAAVPGSRGLIVSLIYRVLTILVALVGVVIYFFSRREVTAALHDAEDEATDEAAAESTQTSASKS